MISEDFIKQVKEKILNALDKRYGKKTVTNPIQPFSTQLATA